MNRKPVTLLVILTGLLLTSCTPGTFWAAEPTITPQPTPSISLEEFLQDGNAFLEESNYIQAEAIFLEAVSVYPDAAAAHTGLAFSILKQDTRYTQGFQAAQRAVQLEPQNGIALALLANFQIKLLLYEDALASAESAYLHDPAAPITGHTLVRAALHANRYPEALEIMKKVMENDPEAPNTYTLLGDYFAATAQFARTEAAYRKAATLAPEDTGILILAARFYLSQDKFAQASESANQILELDPDHAGAYLLLVQTYARQLRWKLAEESVDKLIALDSHAYFSLLAQGDLHFYQGQFDQAIFDYQQAIRPFPKAVYAQQQIGTSYLLMGNCNLALSHFQMLTTSYPEEASFRLGEANAHLCHQNLGQAKAQFSAIIERNPNNYAAYQGLAQVYAAQGDWEPAEAAMLQALMTAPRPSEIHTGFGKQLSLEGKLAQAENELRLALDLNPYSMEATALLVEVFVKQGELYAADQIIQQAEKLDPSDLSVLFMRGYLSYARGEYSKAAGKMNAILIKQPEHPSAQLYLALSLRNQGEMEAASQALENYLLQAQADPGQPDLTALNTLQDSLKAGYWLPEETGLAIIQALYNQQNLPRANPRLVNIKELGNTLVINLYTDEQHLTDGSFMADIGENLTRDALIVPRIEPAVDGGIRLIVQVEGGTTFNIDLELTALQQFADSLLDENELVRSMQYTVTDETARIQDFSTIYRDVAALRGLPVQVIPDQHKITVRQLQAQAASSLDGETRQSMDLEEQMLDLLGVIPEEFEYANSWAEKYSESVAGFYIPAEDEIYLVERDVFSTADQFVLAHESTHSLQFHELLTYEFAAADADLNKDESLALLSVIEGDATFSARMYIEEFVPSYQQVRMTAAADLHGQPSEPHPAFLSGRSSFPYDMGGKFIQALYQIGGWDKVNEVYKDPPASSEQIIHPELYLDRGNGAAVPVRFILADDVLVLEPYWTVSHQDILGEVGVYLMLSDYFGQSGAEKAAEGWGGDQYLLMENSETGETVFFLKIVWDSPDQAAEFISYYAAAMNHRLEFALIDENFSLDNHTTWMWSAASEAVIARHNGSDTYILIGSDLESLQIIANEVIH